MSIWNAGSMRCSAIGSHYRAAEAAASSIAELRSEVESLSPRTTSLSTECMMMIMPLMMGLVPVAKLKTVLKLFSTLPSQA